ncbi:MAG: TetR/AcrR family transcriptional regulator [Steroidobacteraceae bacterium]
MATTRSKRRGASDEEVETRARILDAAFAAFMQNGYAATSTLEIATRARVSKRELYSLVGNKEKMLAACIMERARRLRVAADLPVPRDRETLMDVLAGFGTQLLREVTDAAVIAVFRLAIAEAVHAPEVAQALDSIGRETARVALRKIMSEAQAAGLLSGRPAELVEQFSALLWRDWMLGLLLGVAERPSLREISDRARDAATSFLRLHQTESLR